MRSFNNFQRDLSIQNAAPHGCYNTMLQQDRGSLHEGTGHPHVKNVRLPEQHAGESSSSRVYHRLSRRIPHYPPVAQSHGGGEGTSPFSLALLVRSVWHSSLASCFTPTGARVRNLSDGIHASVQHPLLQPGSSKATPSLVWW